MVGKIEKYPAPSAAVSTRRNAMQKCEYNSENTAQCVNIRHYFEDILHGTAPKMQSAPPNFEHYSYFAGALPAQWRM
jgi:hypothetical protein